MPAGDYEWPRGGVRCLRDTNPAVRVLERFPPCSPARSRPGFRWLHAADHVDLERLAIPTIDGRPALHMSFPPSCEL